MDRCDASGTVDFEKQMQLVHAFSFDMGVIPQRRSRIAAVCEPPTQGPPRRLALSRMSMRA